MSEIKPPRWVSDLKKDIRTFINNFDDIDSPFKIDTHGLVMTQVVKWIEPTAEFSKDNQNALRKAINQCVINGIRPKTFLEIGVHRNQQDSSTGIILENLPKDGIYLGIDLEDKSYLDDHENGIYTLRENSSNYSSVTNKLESIGITKLDFIFIDGWHSINQVCQDWEYVNLLRPGGVVAFHDVTYHMGPSNFIRNLDKSKWVVNENLCPQDYGLGYCYRLFEDSDEFVSTNRPELEKYSSHINHLNQELNRLRDTNNKLREAIFILANRSD
jgi:hypothetical protein